MAIDSSDTDERQARIDAMVDEFRAAQQRRVVKQGIGLWNRAETAHQAKMCIEAPLPEKVH